MDDSKAELLRQLHSPRPDVRDLATQKLWKLWFGAAGPQAERELLSAERLIENEQLAQAESELNDIITRYPTFAEAWNRRATLHYLRREYEASLSDCHEVVRLEPFHFGAWHGIGLCLLALHRYVEAIGAFRRALEIQPFARVNRELIAACLAKLN